MRTRQCAASASNAEAAQETSVERDQFVIFISHLELFHIGELAQAVTRFDAFAQILPLRLGKFIDKVDRRLVYSEQIRGAKDADILRDRRGGARARAVTVYGHILHHVDEGDTFAEVVDDRLRRFRHTLLKFVLRASPLLTVFRVDHRFADLAVGAADADILQRAAVAAHRVAFEVRVNDHRIIIKDALAHRHLFEVPATLDGQHRRAELVHDIHLAEVEAICPDRLAVPRRRLTRA